MGAVGLIGSLNKGSHFVIFSQTSLSPRCQPWSPEVGVRAQKRKPLSGVPMPVARRALSAASTGAHGRKTRDNKRTPQGQNRGRSKFD